MRFQQQENILNSLKIISDANNIIGKIVASGDINMLVQLLDNVIMLFVKVEDAIKSSAGSEGKTLKLVSGFKHSLLEKQKNMQASKKMDESITEHINRFIKTITNSVITDLKPNSLEVVFIASRPSTIGSMETVFHAASADKNCDVYFIPVGFHDKQPFDTDIEYYKNLGFNPINFEAYDFKTRRPDIIFFDYPYDAFGEQYAGEYKMFSFFLRNNCKLLVHIPYYIACYSDRLKMTGKYTHTGGIAHAHYTIFQSEFIRRIAIQEYKEYESENNVTNAFGKAEEKFVALGSPKFDLLVTTKEDDYVLPKEWNELITRPDGTRKKIIFFNTHFRGFLQFGFQYFKKVEFFLNIARKYNNFAILWRPHPLTHLDVGIDPEVLAALNTLVEMFKKEKLGIYDKSSDINRAVMLSDALYGNGSSVQTMFVALCKPVMRMNYDIEVVTENSNPLPTINPNDSLDLMYEETEDCNIFNLIKHLTQPQIIDEALIKKQKAQAIERFGPLDGGVGNSIYEFCKDKAMLLSTQS